MINAILTGIINLLMSLVNVVLAPIDKIITTLLSQFFPDLKLFISSVLKFLDIVSNGLGWAISSIGLSTETLSIIVLYYTFKLTAPLLFTAIKSAIKWYKSLKL